MLYVWGQVFAVYIYYLHITSSRQRYCNSTGCCRSGDKSLLYELLRVGNDTITALDTCTEILQSKWYQPISRNSAEGMWIQILAKVLLLFSEALRYLYVLLHTHIDSQSSDQKHSRFVPQKRCVILKKKRVSERRRENSIRAKMAKEPQNKKRQKTAPAQPPTEKNE